MKRILTMALLLQSNFLLADTILGGEVGANYWNYSSEGAYADSSNLTTFNFDDASEMVVFAALEHPIPLIPNFKFRNNPVEIAGNVLLTGDFDYSGVTFPGGSEMATQADLTNRDLVFYYELLDNRIVSLDLGANFKWFDGAMSANSLSAPALQASRDFQAVVPMIYGKLRADLWGTGLYGSAEVNYVSLSDNKLQDYQVALGYALIENLAITVNIEAGYRVMDIHVDDLDDIYADFKMDGAWLGVVLDF